MIHDYDSPPDFGNTEGTKFWLDKSLNRYARQPDQHGTTLENISCMIVHTKDGMRTRLLFDEDECIADIPDYEAVAARIDMMKFEKRCGEIKTQGVSR